VRDQEPASFWLKEGLAPQGSPTGQTVDSPEERAPDAPLCCVRCGHVITRESHRTTVSGRHTHTRFNPYGFVFHFSWFSQAARFVKVTSEAGQAVPGSEDAPQGHPRP
jgi:hypothetical protein